MFVFFDTDMYSTLHFSTAHTYGDVSVRNPKHLHSTLRVWTCLKFPIRIQNIRHVHTLTLLWRCSVENPQIVYIQDVPRITFVTRRGSEHVSYMLFEGFEAQLILMGMFLSKTLEGFRGVQSVENFHDVGSRHWQSTLTQTNFQMKPPAHGAFSLQHADMLEFFRSVLRAASELFANV